MDRLTAAIADRHSDPWFTSFLTTLPNPDHVLRKAGVTQQVYQEILADSHVFAKVTDRHAGVQRLEWRVEPDGAGRSAKRAAHLCDVALKRMARHLDYPLHQSLVQIQDAVLFGYRGMEVVWESRPEGMLPACLVEVPNRRLVHDGDGWRLLTRDDPVGGIALPSNKILMAAHMPGRDNPYGEPLLSRCFWPYTFKHSALKWWVALGEKYGMPWVIAEGVDEKKRQEVGDALHQMVMDAVAVLPKDAKVRLEWLNGSVHDVHERLIRMCNSEISKVLVGQTLSTEMDGATGSRAATETHAELRDEIIEGDRKVVAWSMERLFAWIIEVNQLPPDTPVPRFRWVDEDKPDKTRAEVAEIALRAIPPALVPLAWARQQFGMPEPEAGEVMVASPVPTPAPSLAASFASGLPRPDWQGAVDGLMEHALAMAQPAAQKQAEAIARVIQESKDYEELSARLAEVMRGLDGEVVAAVMEQATLAAQLYGQWTVREESKRDSLTPALSPRERENG